MRVVGFLHRQGHRSWLTGEGIFFLSNTVHTYSLRPKIESLEEFKICI